MNKRRRVQVRAEYTPCPVRSAARPVEDVRADLSKEVVVDPDGDLCVRERLGGERRPALDETHLPSVCSLGILDFIECLGELVDCTLSELCLGLGFKPVSALRLTGKSYTMNSTAECESN